MDAPVMDGYIRVSRKNKREGPSYISPTVQREAIQRWADYRGVQIAKWHVDEDESGGTHQRPGLEDAIERAMAGETQGIVSWKVDRFSRFTEAALHDLRQLQSVGARLAFVSEDIDAGAAMGKMVYTLMLSQAEFFLENIRAGWDMAVSRAVERGVAISRTPWGFERNEDGTLSPHPERAAYVQEAFALAASGTVQDAMAYLRRVMPDRTWDTTKVRKLLRQRTYLGEVMSGEHVRRDAHDALVTEATWNAAQHCPGRRKPNENFPLTGVARCFECGRGLVGGRSGGRGDKPSVRAYVCTGWRDKDNPCAAPPAIRAARLEGYLRDWVREELPERITVGESADDGPEQRRQAADEELQAFASDLVLRRALGAAGYHRHLQERIDAVQAANDECRRAAAATSAVAAYDRERILNDPEMLAQLSGSLLDIRVRRGRNLGERVLITPLDSNVAAAVTRTQDA